MKVRAVLTAAGLILVVLAGAACGGGKEAGPSATPPRQIATPSGPVTISFWHVATGGPKDTLTRLTDQFNASQDRITVSLVFQGTYDDNMNKILASLGSGDLPALAQLDDPKTQLIADSGAAVPVQDFIDAEGYDLSDFLPQVLDYYRVGGRLLGMPFNVTNPILYYNKKAFEKAGLDPQQPPRTLDDVRAYSQKIVDAGVAPHGIALDINPWYFEQMLSKAGAEFVNNGNGREARATEVAFDGPQGLAIFTWWKDMVASGLALNVGRNPTGADQILAIASQQAEMTIGSVSALRSVVNLLQSGQYPDIELGTGFLPGPAGGTGGVVVGGGALYIMASRPARRAGGGLGVHQVLVVGGGTGGVVRRHRLHPHPSVVSRTPGCSGRGRAIPSVPGGCRPASPVADRNGGRWPALGRLPTGTGRGRDRHRGDAPDGKRPGRCSGRRGRSGEQSDPGLQ